MNFNKKYGKSILPIRKEMKLRTHLLATTYLFMCFLGLEFYYIIMFIVHIRF